MVANYAQRYEILKYSVTPACYDTTLSMLCHWYKSIQLMCYTHGVQVVSFPPNSTNIEQTVLVTHVKGIKLHEILDRNYSFSISRRHGSNSKDEGSKMKTKTSSPAVVLQLNCYSLSLPRPFRECFFDLRKYERMIADLAQLHDSVHQYSRSTSTLQTSEIWKKWILHTILLNTLNNTQKPQLLHKQKLLLLLHPFLTPNQQCQTLSMKAYYTHTHTLV